MFKRVFQCLLTAVMLFMISRAAAAGPSDHQNTGSGGLALKGYDPVSYFTTGPAEGRKDLTADYGGAVYRFQSEENRKKFVEKPEKYAPAYGGWCATAMADGGRKVDIDPKNYKVTDGRLFLFYKGFFGDARKDWVKAEPKNTELADREWKKLTGE